MTLNSYGRDCKRYPLAPPGTILTPASAQHRALTALEKLRGKPVVLRDGAQLSNHERVHLADLP